MCKINQIHIKNIDDSFHQWEITVELIKGGTFKKIQVSVDVKKDTYHWSAEKYNGSVPNIKDIYLE